MHCCPSLKRWLSAGLTVVIFGGLLAALFLNQPGRSLPDAQAAEEAARARWAMFGGSLARNMVNTAERNMPTEWDVQSGKNIKWTAKLGSKAYGGPVISGGKIFIGTNNDNPRDPNVKGDKGIIMCFNESDGKFLWQVVHDKLPSGRVHDWPREGICSSPFVEGNRLWYVSNRCEVVCRNTDDGKQVWALDMMKELGVFPHNLATCSPIAVGDTLFVITSNGVDEGHINIPRPDAPSFIAVDKNKGTVLWKSNLPTASLLKPGAELKKLVDRGLVLMHGQWSNPVYTTVDGKGQVLFPGGDGWIYAFDPANGEVLWKFDANPKESIYALGGRGTRNDFVSTPVIYDNKLYIGVGQDPEHDQGVGHFWCVDIARATQTKGDVSPEVVASDDGKVQKGKPNPNSAVVWHFGGLVPAGQESSRKWLYGRTLSTAAVHDGLCYISELEGIVHCLDAKTGQKYWEHEMDGVTWSSPYFVDGKVYMGNDKEQVLIFQHGKEKKLLGTIEMDGMVRATPVAANGVLYVMTENKLYAITK